LGTGGPFPGSKTRPGREADHHPHLENQDMDGRMM